MSNLLEECIKMNKINKSNKLLSKKEIIKRFANIKTAKNKSTNESNMNRNIDIKNKRNKNLTYQNFYTKKDINNISENKKIKDNSLLYSRYSSFISKKYRYYNSDFPLTGVLSPNKKSTEIKYNRFFSGKINNRNNNNINLSEDRTKTSTTKNTKSNILNKNSSFNKNDKNDLRLLSSNSSNSNLNFNYKLYNSFLKTPSSHLRRENVSSFMEKTRIIRREKIIKINLENKYQIESESNRDKLVLFKRSKDKFDNNLSLLNKFDSCYTQYLKNLEVEKVKENILCEQLIKEKIELGIDNQKIKHKINKLEIESAKYKNLKELLLLVKYGSDIKDYIEKNNNSENIENRNKKRLTESYSSKNRNNNRRNTYKRYYSINKFKINARNINGNNNQPEKVQNKLIKKTKSLINKDLINEDLELIRSNKKSIFENEFEFNHKITYLENIILKNLNYLNQQRYDINNLKKELNKVKMYNADDDDVDWIPSKIKMLEFVKKENIRLKNKMKLMIKNSSTKIILSNNLENKLLNILIDINNEFNIEEKFNNQLFSILKLEPAEFLNKMNTSKILYMIKIIELVALFLFNLKNRYLTDPKSEKIFKNISSIFEKEKTKQMHLLLKEQIKKDLKKKKDDIIKRNDKIRFHSSRTFVKIFTTSKSKKNKSNRKLRNKSESYELYEKWISYN